MANEFKVKNGIKFPDNTVQTTAASGGGITYTRYTSNITVTDKSGVIADTTGGAFTVTLPATPTTGAQVYIVDGGNWGVNNLTISRNGSTIEGIAQDLVLDIGGIAVTLIYAGTTWEVFSQAGVYIGGGGGSATASGFEQTFMLMGA